MGPSAVDVSGVPQTRSLLARFEPDLLKRLDRRLNSVARDLRSGAQANFERTGASGAAYTIRTRSRRGGFSKAVTTVPGSVGRGERWSSSPGVLARVFEFASGVRNAKPQNVQRTRSLIATLTARYGSPGRFLWAAFDEREVSIREEAASAVREAEDEYTRRLAG